MESIRTSSYAVHFNDMAFNALDAHLKSSSYSKLFILVDENTREHCLKPFMDRVSPDFSFEILEIQAGELYKTIKTCLVLWEQLSDLGADRKSLLINLGGGVVTDLGGFVAATFKRGINFINVPTSLLAMVDASVGGKTGVDLGVLKNQIGVIEQPEMVLIVPHFLKTLDQRQMQSGYAEMLKHGLIKSETYWNALKELNSLESLDQLIYESVLIKNEVVLEDPRENGLRKILNFGHTLGHAIESYLLEDEGRPPLLHGEAIAVGMVLEAYLSHKATGLSLETLNDIKSTMLKRYPKVTFSSKDMRQINSLLKFDKKNSHGKIYFVLLKGIGNPVIDQYVEPQMISEAFTYYAD